MSTQLDPWGEAGIMSPAGLAALDYVARGFAVVPVADRTKRPLIPWGEYQTRRPTEADVVGWYRRHPTAGVALVTGPVSGLVVVDCDPRNGDGAALEARLPVTPTVETGGGGRHYYFAALGERAPKIAALLPGVDFLAAGALATTPPTMHASGRPYRWVPGRALNVVALAPLPSIVRDLIAVYRRRQETERAACRSPRPTPTPAGNLALDYVLDRVRARRAGRGWAGICPAHPDREPSLSIAAGEGGRLLLYCFAGCSYPAILHALTGTPA